MGGSLALLILSSPFIWNILLQPFQRQRIATFFNPESDPFGASWNIIQSKVAIGSGGLFGKVRVNVSLENLQLDVKLTAENSATLAILRASEAVLQSITEINGLKLAEYNVELSNNNQNNNGSRNQKENSGEKDAKMNENQNELDDKLDSSNDDGSHNLNLIA